MTDTSRDARLAAKLRENLHRRKAQSRAQQDTDAQGIAPADRPALPKTPPKS